VPGCAGRLILGGDALHHVGVGFGVLLEVVRVAGDRISGLGPVGLASSSNMRTIWRDADPFGE
jgi:hypothetical protein